MDAFRALYTSLVRILKDPAKSGSQLLQVLLLLLRCAQTCLFVPLLLNGLTPILSAFTSSVRTRCSCLLLLRRSSRTCQLNH